MALTLRSAPTPPPRTPEREALRAAIQALRDETARAAALTSALATAEAAVRTANREVEAAESGIETAKSDAAAHLVASASGNAGDPPPTIRQARDHLQDCQDTLQAARDAQTELKSQQAKGDNVSIYQGRLDAAIDAVIRSEAATQVRAVVDRTHQSRIDLVRGILLVQYLAGRGQFEKNRNGVYESLGGLYVMSQYPLGNYDAERETATATWRAMVERLAADPDASLDLK